MLRTRQALVSSAKSAQVRYLSSSQITHHSPILRELAVRSLNVTHKITSNALIPRNHLRAFSSNTNSKKDKNADGEDRTDLVLTPGQKVVAGTRLTIWGGVVVFASFCLYYIGKELFPTKLSPNSLFSKASSIVTDNREVKRRFGEPLKCYGRDHGSYREGRRNFIEHTEYTDKDDGSKRVRVRFNLEGKFGAAFVFCEVSSDMPSGEFVYLLVQDKRNGMVITLVDNRSRIMAQRMAGGSAAGQEAFGNLLGGSKK
jgi:import inner membrane translocase subunit TIM21